MQLHLEWQLNSVRGELHLLKFALVAQLVEHLICNEKVAGSNPVFGSKCTDGYIEILEECEKLPSGK